MMLLLLLFCFLKESQFHYGLFLLFSDRFKGVNDQIERRWKHNSRRLFESACTLDCSNLDEVQWFKNDEPMKHSNPILTFSSVTTKDSGNYSCSLRNFKTTVSEEFRICIEGWLNW